MQNESNSEIWFDDEFPRDGTIDRYIGEQFEKYFGSFGNNS